MATLSLFSARRDAGAWSVLEILGVSGDPLAVSGASCRWRVERPRNSGRKWRPSRCFPCVVTLARGASSKFWAQVSTFSLFSACRDASAWSVLEILGVSGDLLVVFRVW